MCVCVCVCSYIGVDDEKNFFTNAQRSAIVSWDLGIYMIGSIRCTHMCIHVVLMGVLSI